MGHFECRSVWWASFFSDDSLQLGLRMAVRKVLCSTPSFDACSRRTSPKILYAEWDSPFGHRRYSARRPKAKAEKRRKMCCLCQSTTICVCVFCPCFDKPFIIFSALIHLILSVSHKFMDLILTQNEKLCPKKNDFLFRKSPVSPAVAQDRVKQSPAISLSLSSCVRKTNENTQIHYNIHIVPHHCWSMCLFWNERCLPKPIQDARANVMYAV